MKQRLVRSARVALKALSTATDPLFGRLPGPRILIYHQVGIDLGRQMDLSTEAFIHQLDWMQSHGEIVDLDTAIAHRAEPDADKLYVLTFDDGFADVYHNAFPVLAERNLPFTLYLTTEPIETQQPINRDYPTAQPFTWDQLQEMMAGGLVTIGAHTHTHPDLRKLSGDAIANELDVSNQLIEQRLGVRPRHFTYPWGRPSATADELVRERYATSTVGAPGKLPEDANEYSLPRFPVQRSDNLYFFNRRLKGGFRVEEAVRSVRARYG